MVCDSVHGNIQTKIRSQDTIIDIEDFVEVIESSRKDMKCVIMDHTAMREFTDESRKVRNLFLKDLHSFDEDL